MPGQTAAYATAKSFSAASVKPVLPLDYTRAHYRAFRFKGPQDTVISCLNSL